MQHDESQFVGAGGMQLYYQTWRPLTQKRAVLVAIHGLGAHSGSFKNLVKHFVARGFVIYSFDLRGHGRSPGQRGYISRWAEFREDLRCFLQLIQMQEPNLPCFLIGHSLGGVIALEYGLRSPYTIAGIVASAPALKQVGVPPLRMMLGRVLSWLYPRFSLNTGIDLSAVSRDPAVLKIDAEDPLRHTRGTARLATEFLATTHWLWQHAADLQVPLLILHGAADRVTSSLASQEFFDQITFTDKQRYEYSGGYHDLYDDIICLQVLSDLENWLEQHLPPALLRPIEMTTSQLFSSET